jgi:hypothetical protein
MRRCFIPMIEILRRNGGISMVVQENVQIVKDAYAAFGRGDMQGLLALFAEDTEWIAPLEGLPLSGPHSLNTSGTVSTN